MSFKKKIAVALLGLTMMGGIATLPSVKVGPVSIGAETVQAYSGNYAVSTYIGREYRYHNGAQSRQVWLNKVYNRNGRFMYSYKVYGAWHRYSVG